MARTTTTLKPVGMFIITVISPFFWPWISDLHHFNGPEIVRIVQHGPWAIVVVYFGCHVTVSTAAVPLPDARWVLAMKSFQRILQHITASCASLDWLTTFWVSKKGCKHDNREQRSARPGECLKAITRLGDLSVSYQWGTYGALRLWRHLSWNVPKHCTLS